MSERHPPQRGRAPPSTAIGDDRTGNTINLLFFSSGPRARTGVPSMMEEHFPRQSKD